MITNEELQKIKCESYVRGLKMGLLIALVGIAIHVLVMSL